jgi:hypothetical protein
MHTMLLWWLSWRLVLVASFLVVIATGCLLLIEEAFVAGEDIGSGNVVGVGCSCILGYAGVLGEQ